MAESTDDTSSDLRSGQTTLPAPIAVAPGMSELTLEARREDAELPRLQRTTVIAYLIAIAAGALYSLFIFNPKNAGQLVPYIFLIIAEVILISNQLVMILTILAGDRGQEDDRRVVQDARRQLLNGQWTPSIDVLIPVRGEPIDVIERTARAARDMRIAHRTFICDDGRSDAVRDLADRLGVSYLRRDDSDGAKAGNINRAMQRTSGEFVAIFDSDHVPRPHFLEAIIPHFVDDGVAFVQSPQSYNNRHESPVASAAHESQRVFYDLVCPGKDAYNSVFSVGTNLAYRRAALADVEGLYEHTNSEDIWSSVRLHQRGWSSVYLPMVLSEGLAPTQVHTYMTQQFRWSRGAFEVLLHGRPWRLRGLSRDQRIQYLQPALHYLQSFAMLFFMLLPALFLVFYVQPLRVESVGWLLRYAPFWIMTQLAIYYQLGRLHGWSYAMAIASAPVHVRAFFSALFRRKYGWKVTNRAGEVPPVIDTLPTQIVLALALVGAFIIGLFPITSSLPTIISLVLCLLYAFALGAVILRAMKDRREARRAASKPLPVPAEVSR
jgi:cellulose synthase (UDP-forming)